MRRSWSVGVLLVLLVVSIRPEPARAWNPVTAAANGLRAVGRFIGAPLGGLVESASTPTIHDLEDSGHRLVTDATSALGHEVDHAGSVTAGIVAQVDSKVAARLDQVDHSLTARIAQVKTGLDDSVDHALGRLDRSIGAVDAMARARIAQVGKE